MLTREGREGDLSRPEDLDGAPRVEDEEDNSFVLHVFQTAEDDEKNDVPPCHLWQHRAEWKEVSD